MAESNPLRLVFVVSFLAHAAGGLALTSIKIEKKPEPIVVEMRTIERKPKPATPPPPPPPEAPVAKAAPPKPAAPPPPAPAAPSAAPAPDFGISLGGMGSGGPGGIAVPVGTPGGGQTRQAEKTLTAAVPKAPEDGCGDEEVKAKPLDLPQPAYTEEGRAAGVEGRVRVEIRIDASGAVVDVKVVEGLGYGLDEAALTAVRAATFTPATRCGSPVASTLKVGIRFAL